MANWLQAILPSEEEKAKREKEKQIKALMRTKDGLQSGSNQIVTAHNKLTDTVDRLDGFITVVQETDLTALKENFDKTYNLPQEYKDQLKEEMEKERERTIQDLVPLRDKAEKLRAHMFVSKYKIGLWANTVKCKAEVVDSAHVQIERLKELKSQGDMVSKEIEDILRQCEDINKSTDSTVESMKENDKLSIIDIPFSKV